MCKCLLIPILTGLISALLGYLIGRLSGKGGNHDDCNERIATLEAELKSCKTNLSLQKATAARATMKTKATTTKPSTRSSFTGSKVTGVLFDAVAAKAAFGKKIKENDLTIVEGIGPKIQGLFHNFGIKTWADLAATSIKKCEEVLESGGARYKMHTPKTWPKQAGLAAKGNWKKLKDWQDALDGGR